MTAVGHSVGTGQPVRERTDALVARLGERRFRCRVYALIAAAIVVAAFVAVALKARFVKQSGFNFIVSDARMYYAYLPSAVIDHDLDLYNQIKEHWGDEFRPGLLEDRTPTGYVRDQFPVGIAVTLSPAFVVAHAITVPLYRATGKAVFVPDGYSPPYQVACVLWAMGLGLWSLVLIDGLLERRFRVDGASIFAAVVVYWVGTNYAWYYFREPLMSHVIDAFWVIACVSLIDAIVARARHGRVVWWQVTLLAFCGSMAAVCRLTNFFILPVFVYLLYQVVLLRVALPFLGWAAASVPALFPLGVQLYVWGLMTGRWPAASAASAPAPAAPAAGMAGGGLPVQTITTYAAHETFHFIRPALAQTLFSSRHGVFFWSPVLLLSVWGLAWHFWRRGGWRDGLFVGFIVSALVLWYFNSAWYAWWFGDAYGARAFLELAGLFIIGLAFAFEYLKRVRPGVRGVVWGVIGVCVVLNGVMMCLFMLNRITRNDYMISWWI